MASAGSGDGPSGVYEMAAGRFVQVLGGEPEATRPVGLVGDVDVDFSELRIHAFGGGGLTWFARFVGDVRTEPMIGGDGPDAARIESAVDGGGGFWSAPSPTQAAGVGVLALLAAALYYFWPSIKALPLVGGFSRLC